MPPNTMPTGYQFRENKAGKKSINTKEDKDTENSINLYLFLKNNAE